MKRKGLFFVSLLCFILLNSSCAEKERKPILEVRCRYWLQQCHLKARNRCRSGYSVVQSIRRDKVGGPQGSYKEFKMKITCN